MGYTPLTPFRRVMDAAQLQHQQHAFPPATARPVSKWDALRELAAARRSYGLSDRDLAVLQALLSFHPETDLDPRSGPVVFPSNAAICERLNGMPCSTMRRHLGRLVDAGILLRRDSPNGKRYRHRGATFGFDLMPLVSRFAEFSTIAAELQRAADELAVLRQSVSLMRRDLAALTAWGAKTRPDLNWDAQQDLELLSARTLRRKLSHEELVALRETLGDALQRAQHSLGVLDSEVSSTSDAQNEQHYQYSNYIITESETACENINTEAPPPAEKPVPLDMVLRHCQEVHTYAQKPLKHWQDLLETVEHIRPMMGIGADVWDYAKKTLGLQQAAATLTLMLERFANIRVPGAYLRRLVQKAQMGQYSVLPMLVATRPSSQL